MTETLDLRQRQLMRFRCLVCGYGASSEQAPERCPMCSGSAWAGASEQFAANPRPSPDWIPPSPPRLPPLLRRRGHRGRP